MNFETALAARLLRAAGIAGEVGDRVGWQVRMQGDPLPDITLDIVTDLRPQNFRGFEHCRRTRAQVTVWHRGKAEAVALRDRVIEALAPSALVDGVTFQRATEIAVLPRHERRDATESWQEIIDLILTHNG